LDKYPKLFIKASLIYLVIGVSFGVAMSFNPIVGIRFGFVHIHTNLLGFMVMMIAGVSYHVLPRFSSRPFPWLNGIKFHFYLQNIGLLGMIVAYLAGYRETNLFLFFTGITAVSLMIMAYNLFWILLPPSDKNTGENDKNQHPHCHEGCCPEEK